MYYIIVNWGYMIYIREHLHPPPSHSSLRLLCSGCVACSKHSMGVDTLRAHRALAMLVGYASWLCLTNLLLYLRPKDGAAAEL